MNPWRNFREFPFRNCLENRDGLRTMRQKGAEETPTGRLQVSKEPLKRPSAIFQTVSPGTWVNKREGALSVLTIHREFIADH